MSTIGGHHEYHGGYLESCGGCSVLCGNHGTCGRYNEYHGGIKYCGGKNLLLFEYLHYTEHPYGTHDIPPYVSYLLTVLK